MPAKQYVFESGGPERLEIAWEGSWKNVAVSLDGRLLGSFENQKELKEGQEFHLEDGSTLRVQLVQVVLFPELQISRDGDPLPGSAADPAQRLAAAYGMIFFIAAFNAALGLLAGALQIGFLQSLGLGFESLLSGAAYGVLGVFVRRRSTIALALAVAMFILDGIVFFAMAAKAGGTPPVGGVIARIFFLIPMVRGFGALTALREAEAAPRKAPLRTPATPRAAQAAPSTTPAAAPPPVRVLTGEMERRRLELSQKTQPRAAPARPAGPRPAGHQGRISLKTEPISADAAAASLRFVARRCEIGAQGLRATYPDGKGREIAWVELAALVVRQLPPDPPWDAQILLDAVPVAAAGAAGIPIRVFSTTLVNYGAIPGGSSTTSRLENVRRLAAHIASQNPSATVDVETAAFLGGDKVPARFANMTEFTEYDARYG